MKCQSRVITSTITLNLVGSSVGICIRRQRGLKGGHMAGVALLIASHDRRKGGAHRTLNPMVALCTTEPLTRRGTTLNGNNRTTREPQIHFQRVVNQIPTQGSLKEMVHTKIHMKSPQLAADRSVATLNQHHTNQGETIHNPQGGIQMMPNTTFHLGDLGQESPRSK